MHAKLTTYLMKTANVGSTLASAGHCQW